MTGSQRSRRLNPPWWDHQRQPLVALRDCVQEILERQIGVGDGFDRVLDLGCGDRPYETLIRSQKFAYIGCDLADDADVRITPGGRIEQPDGSAKGIVSFQVLEHVWDLNWYLGECHRLLAAGGWLILSTHGTWPYHPHPTDYRRWTRDGLKMELESRGFVIETIRGLIGPLAWTTQVRALGFRHALVSVRPLKPLAPILAWAMNVRMAIEDAITPKAILEDNACIYVVVCRRRTA